MILEAAPVTSDSCPRSAQDNDFTPYAHNSVTLTFLTLLKSFYGLLPRNLSLCYFGCTWGL